MACWSAQKPDTSHKSGSHNECCKAKCRHPRAWREGSIRLLKRAPNSIERPARARTNAIWLTGICMDMFESPKVSTVRSLERGGDRNRG
ncbi:hypothetical protein D3C76_1658930 [compost metagenome]